MQRPAFARRGLTLAEAMVALSVTAMAGAALLLSAQTSLQVSDDSVERTIARGLAEQVIDEVLGAAYCAKGGSPYETSLGRNDWENSGLGRERYSDTDDWTGVRQTGLKDRFGSTLGTGNGAGGSRPSVFRVRSNYFTNWKLEIDVYYVSASNTALKLSAGQTSNFRAVEVRVLKVEGGLTIPVADARRVYTYVPNPGT